MSNKSNILSRGAISGYNGSDQKIYEWQDYIEEILLMDNSYRWWDFTDESLLEIGEFLPDYNVTIARNRFNPTNFSPESLENGSSQYYKPGGGEFNYMDVFGSGTPFYADVDNSYLGPLTCFQILSANSYIGSYRRVFKRFFGSSQKDLTFIPFDGTNKIQGEIEVYRNPDPSPPNPPATPGPLTLYVSRLNIDEGASFGYEGTSARIGKYYENIMFKGNLLTSNPADFYTIINYLELKYGL